MTKDDEKEFEGEGKGAPLVLMVQPEKVVHACGTCRHHRGEPPLTMYCHALGGRTCASLRDKWTCPMWQPIGEPKPAPKSSIVPPPPRVGLLRWLFRLLW